MLCIELDLRNVYALSSFPNLFFYKSFKKVLPYWFTGLLFSAVELFLFTEEHRSRCYGRTSALRLIVQPCDEAD